MGKYLKFATKLPVRQILPAVGQGALAIEVRKSDREAFQIARTLNHTNTEKSALAERVFLETLEGGCRVPAGIYSKIEKEKLFLKAAVFSTKTSACVRAEISGLSKDYERLGKSLAISLLKRGAKKFLKEARNG